MASMPNNVPPIEIRISEDMLQKLGWILLGVTVVFTLLGVIVSPRDEQGKPVLLLPDVKAVQDYRRTAQTWTESFAGLDGEIDRVISTNPEGDLFTQSQSTQQTLQHAVQLAKQVDRASVPPIAMGVHEKAMATAMAYLEAARSALQWISAPDQTNHDQAAQTLEIARTSMDELEANQWLTAR
jgi:hypothetical protein